MLIGREGRNGVKNTQLRYLAVARWYKCTIIFPGAFMKAVFGLLSLAISVTSTASTFGPSNDTKKFLYDGSQSSAELVLKTVKTRTESRTEEVERTCYDRRVVGSRTICRQTGYPGPYYPGPYHPGPHYPGPHRHPHYPTSGQCYTENVVKEIPYSCLKTETTYKEVIDFKVETRAIVDVTNLSQEAVPAETFQVTVEGDRPIFMASSSKNLFIIAKKIDLRSSMVGPTKMIDALYATELKDSAPFLNSVKITKTEIDNSILKIQLAQVEDVKNLGISLEIIQHKIISSDVDLIRRGLEDREFRISSSGQGYEATIDLKKLGLNISNGKFTITAKANPKALLNYSQFYNQFPSRTFIYKAR
jgi:hypothetical protein